MTRGPGFTYAVFDEVRVFTPEVLRTLAPAVAGASVASLVRSALVADTYRTELLLRRDRLCIEVFARYGVDLYPHPRRAHVVVCAASDLAVLRAAVMHDSRLSAVGRGYYFGLGGEIDVVSAADWTCDPRAVSRARLVARTAVPAARWLLRSLRRPLPRTLAHRP